MTEDLVAVCLINGSSLAFGITTEYIYLKEMLYRLQGISYII